MLIKQEPPAMKKITGQIVERATTSARSIRLAALAAATLFSVSVVVSVASAPAGADTRTGNVLDYKPTVTATGPTFVHDARAEGAKIELKQIDADKSSVIEIRVSNLRNFAGRTVGAHVHAKPCAADPAASGPHYANPAGDKASALAAREIWLDFSVDSLGRGVGVAIFDFPVKAGDANSVVIHAESTNAVTGGAGARVMCTDLKIGK
jgi:Cu/Zn superoxide dismutase